MMLQPGSPNPVGDGEGQAGVSSAQYETDDLLHPRGAWWERKGSIMCFR